MASELQKDIAELEQLRQKALRGNVQMALDGILNDWRLKLDAIQSRERHEKEQQKMEPLLHAGEAHLQSHMHRPAKKLTTYAFDESDKFVKLYYNLPGATAEIPHANITAKFNDDAFDVVCRDVDGVDYTASARGFIQTIDPAHSVVKPKTDSLLVMLKKKREGQTWSSLLKLEKRAEPKMPDYDAGGDPQEGLMKMMKKMYDEGDDQMKQTMRKAWTEAQDKKKTGGPGGGMGMDF